MTRGPASPATAAYLRGYTDYAERTGGFTTRRELPHGEGVLIFNLGAPLTVTGGNGQSLRLAGGEAFVAGAHLLPALSTSTGTQEGLQVQLPLATLRRLLGVPMHQLANRVLPLDRLLGSAAGQLGQLLGETPDAAARMALLDATLARWLAAAPEPDRRLTAALGLLRARPDQDIASVARQVGWSRKHLASRLHDAVGTGPRCWRRLLRFQSLVARIDAGAVDWAMLAQEAGYCDQPHMIREFRAFSGLTPTHYLQLLLPDGGGLMGG